MVITHRVANRYGYPSWGTYCRTARRTDGSVVVGIWVDSTNRAGQFPGVTARREDRVQAQIDALKANDDILVISAYDAACVVDSEIDSGLLSI